LPFVAEYPGHHPDQHEIAFLPSNPNIMFSACDGGISKTTDNTATPVVWSKLNDGYIVNQFYTVAIDHATNNDVIIGGLQDNGSWFAPSSTSGGLDNEDWKSIGFGDGFSVIPDLSNSDYVYWEFQGGGIYRYNKKTFENKDIKPQPMKGEDKLRGNWNSPIHQSTINPGTIYFGSQYLYKTIDKGETWNRISPDLTTNDPNKQNQEESGGLSVDNSSAENHCTIFSICESPVDANIIWVGTDDGNLQVSQNGGTSWNNVIKNVPGLKENTWVSSIDASVFDRNTVFVSFDAHADGDKKPYIYRTTDLGKTWTSIATNQIEGYVHKIKQDIINPNLLFAGSVFGLYVSLDAGKNWSTYTGNFPRCEVRDITIHPEKGDLLVATHGRGLIILDDLTPIRNINDEVLNSEAYVLPTRSALINNVRLGSGFVSNVGMYIGQNAPEDAVIVYYLKDRLMTGDINIGIYNNAGNLLKSLPGTKRKGINRVTWNMRLKPPKVAPGVSPDQSGFIGPFISEGSYVIKLTKGDKTFTGTLEVIQDPYSPYSKEDIALRDETASKIFKMHEDLAFIVYNVNKIKDKAKKLVADGKLSAAAGDELINKLEDLRKESVTTKESKGITGEERLKERISQLYTSVVFFGGRPTQQQIERIGGLEFELNNVSNQADEIYKNYLIKVNAELKAKGMEELTPSTKDEFEKSEEKKPS
ncbi:MAG: glycosyl hydrolase, partial [Ignavibacteria bacterium]